MALDSNEIRRKIEAIQDLPTLPTVVSSIVSVTHNPKTSATDVGNLISKDQALTAKVLKLVNSAYYGFPRQISTINHAIVILGFSKVKNLVLTASVFDRVSTKGGEANFSMPEFWEHSLGTAIASRVVARYAGEEAIDDVFVAGLLHDVGKAITAQFLKDHFKEILGIVHKQDCLYREAEMSYMGFAHDTIGVWIAERWKLPSPILSSVKHHHNPTAARQDKGFIYAVHLGDILARAMLIGSGGDRKIPAVHPVVWDELMLSPEAIEKIGAEIRVERARADEFFNMIKR